MKARWIPLLCLLKNSVPRIISVAEEIVNTFDFDMYTFMCRSRCLNNFVIPSAAHCRLTHRNRTFFTWPCHLDGILKCQVIGQYLSLVSCSRNISSVHRQTNPFTEWDISWCENRFCKPYQISVTDGKIESNYCLTHPR